MVIQGYAFSFDDEKLFVGTQQNCLVAKILISTQGIYLQGNKQRFPLFITKCAPCLHHFFLMNLYTFSPDSAGKKKQLTITYCEERYSQRFK